MSTSEEYIYYNATKLELLPNLNFELGKPCLYLGQSFAILLLLCENLQSTCVRASTGKAEEALFMNKDFVYATEALHLEIEFSRLQINHA